MGDPWSLHLTENTGGGGRGCFTRRQTCCAGDDLRVWIWSNALACDAVEYEGVVRAETASSLVFAVLVSHAFVCVSGLFEVEFF